MRNVLYVLLVTGILTGCSSEEYVMTFEVNAGDYAMVDAPVYIELETQMFDEGTSFCLHSDNEIVPGQVENVGDGQRIWWVVNIEPGETVNYGLTLGDGCRTGDFEWERIEDNAITLFFENQPVIRYEHPVYDPGNVEGTKKPFHHVFEPDGNRLITKGAGGLYSHHRGIFFGYNHVIPPDGDTIDIWHAADRERSEHVETLSEYGGPVFGGHKVLIHWKDRDGNTVIEEQREVRVFTQTFGSSLLDFYSNLEPVNGPVMLEGDRQHAGVQFRASQLVAENTDSTRFIRPSDRYHLDPDIEIEGEDMFDMPWNAMQFWIYNKLFTVSYMSSPENPPYAEMSERLYGRFGEYFPYFLTNDKPLEVSYRFWIKAGNSPSINDLNFRYQVFATPPAVADRTSTREEKKY